MKQTNKTPIPRFRTALALSLLLGACSVGYSQDDSAEDDEIFELSPFEVTASDQDIGYRKQNTLAGSRLNTNLADLAAPIAVITLEQLEDTASLDINDVLRYEVSTEGSSTYTPGTLSQKGDGLADTNAGYAGGDGVTGSNATTNTVRGLGSPESAINFYRAIRQIPLDAYNVQSISISRGPNSMLFGIGKPSGFVNQSRTTAVLNQDAYSVNVRVDDRESKRASFSFNKALIEDKLAFAGAVLEDNQEFERKPSYDDTKRYFGTLTYKPFERTKLTASIEKYENKANRPNSLMPKDYVSEWRDAGQPVYDPSSMKVTYLSTGEEVGPFVSDALSYYINDVRDYIKGRPDYKEGLWGAATIKEKYYDDQGNVKERDLTIPEGTYNGVTIYGSDALTNSDSILYVPGLDIPNGKSIMQVGNGQVVNFFQPNAGLYIDSYGALDPDGVFDPSRNSPPGPTVVSIGGLQPTDIQANPLNAAAYNQFWTTSNVYSNNDSNIADPKYPSVSDQSIYDWTKVNTLRMNYGEKSGTTLNLDFQQKLTDDLYLSGGWFEQKFDSFSSYTVSQQSSATLRVDTNVTLPNGEANPYLGQAYLEDYAPDRWVSSIKNDQYRVMLAYTPDFTNNDGWTKWLGSHQFIAYASREEQDNTVIRKRLAFTSGEEEAAGMIRFLPNPNNNLEGNPTGYAYEDGYFRRQFYLGLPGTPNYGTVNTSSGMLTADQFTLPVNVYNYGTSQWQDVNMTAEYVDSKYSTGASGVRTDSWSIGGTSHFWNDRIVATYGIRSDENKTRRTVYVESAYRVTDEEGVETVLIPALTKDQYYANGLFDTGLAMERYAPWATLQDESITTGLVVRPFKNWDSIDSSAKAGNVFAQFISTLGITYNKSSTFDPPETTGVDYFGNPLDKPLGEGEDIGIQFSLFQNKLFAKISHYESTNENSRSGLGNTLNSRFQGYVDKWFQSWAYEVALINMGQDPTDWRHWGSNRLPDEAAKLEFDQELERIYGMPVDYYSTLPGDIKATQSIFAKGEELQIIYNPIPNWTMKLTASKQETINDGVLKEWDAWYNYRYGYIANAKATDFLKPEYQHYATEFVKDANGVDTNVNYNVGSRAHNITSYQEGFGFNGYLLNSPSWWPWKNGKDAYDLLVSPLVTLAQDLNGQVVTNQAKYQARFLTNYKFTGDALKGFTVGGALRWHDKKSIGYYGAASGAAGEKLDISDISKPFYTPAQTYVDLSASYSRKIMNDRVDMKLQLNVVNAFENGGLQTVQVDLEGNPTAYRIVDPRKFILQATFKM